MSSVWSTAWAFSLLLSGGAFLAGRKSGLAITDSLILAVACFPSPISYLLTGRNSFIYPLDVLTPLLLFYGWKSWPAASQSIRRAAALLIVSCGVLPLAISTIFSADRNANLFNIINLYRTTAAMLIMVRFNAIRRSRPIKSYPVAALLSWFGIVLLAAMLAKLAGLNSDVFNAVQPGIGEVWNSSSSQFDVLGLFRGSIGVLSTLAVCAFFSGAFAGAGRAVGLLGALCGCAAVLMCGSKTSLLSIAVLIPGSVLLRKSFSQFTIIALLIASVTIGLIVVDVETAYAYIPTSMESFLKSRGQDIHTLEFRNRLWDGSFEAILDNPLILLGIVPKDAVPRLTVVSPYVPGYYHNEYVSVTMLGGAWGLSCYLAGLLLVALAIARNRKRDPLAVLSLLALGAGVVQAITVAHLQSGLLFGMTTSLVAALYGIGGGSFPARGRARLNVAGLGRRGIGVPTELWTRPL